MQYFIILVLIDTVTILNNGIMTFNLVSQSINIAHMIAINAVMKKYIFKYNACKKFTINFYLQKIQISINIIWGLWAIYTCIFIGLLVPW